MQTITQDEINRCLRIISDLSKYYDVRVVGQKNLKFALIAATIADGHILLESVPGLAKTTAAKAIADAVDGRFSRIQCTPDLLPSDIQGTQIYNSSTGKFETSIGPVYANFVLLDEINRSSAKTQSAMLEAMQEHQVTIGGVPYAMPDVFIVIATQNPIEQEGTYLLSEAQLDRFMVKVKIKYPKVDDEVEILNRIESGVITKTDPVLNIDDIKYLQKTADRVYMDAAIKKYIANLIAATRHADKVLPPEMAKYVRTGASPRGSIAFMEIAKAIALIYGRGYVTPDDVKLMKHEILRHRIELNYSAIADGVSVEDIIDKIVGAVQTP